MKGRITILCENSVGPITGALGEHGFAALIEPSEGEPLMFDTGQGLTLLHNARRMNKDLSLVKKVVISHGHYDHTGGLKPLLEEFGAKQVLGHPGIFREYIKALRLFGDRIGQLADAPAVKLVDLAA